MITPRDKKVMDFLNTFHIARTSTIEELFYPSSRVARNRLNELYSHKEIKRERDGPGAEYVWYIKKPKQFLHSLALTDFYRDLSRKHSVTQFAKEPPILGIRPDALIKFDNIPAFVEIELSHKPLDVGKYERLKQGGEYKNYFTRFPPIILISDKKPPKSALEIIRAVDL